MGEAVFDLSRVVAPMVGQSDAPFRALCLKYGATCAYSEMLSSQLIIEDESYLEYSLPKADHLLQDFGYQTRPLVVQICGNDPLQLSKAVIAIAKTGRADAIDFNLGCPQEKAKTGLFGSYLLDKCHWPLVFDCVKAMVSALEDYHLPLFCKIRLIEGNSSRDVLNLTKQFCL
jgi:tRNA-dihydrouridine synthase 1